MKARLKEAIKKIKDAAIRLVSDPRFLFKAKEKVAELGVVGEERNVLAVLLACISAMLPDDTASLMIKGSTSSGKSTVLKLCVQLFPPDCVVERAGLSGKALAYGDGPLAGKILLLNEYRCGKDAQQLLRLLQSEGSINHEATTLQGAHRTTATVRRFGMPVVLTTTTDSAVFADDETRFFSLWADETPAQTERILSALARGRNGTNGNDLPVWQTAMSLIAWRAGDFRNPPAWLQYIAHRLPLGRVRVRRDWSRFLTFCKAAALCRRSMFKPGEALDISFPDYCVVYQILEPVLAGTIRGVNPQELALRQAVTSLNQQLRRAATHREIAEELRWKESLVYKHAKNAVRHKVLHYEAGNREKNVKRLLAPVALADGFLPRPGLVFRDNPEIGNIAKYVNPFTGKTHVFQRKEVR